MLLLTTLRHNRINDMSFIKDVEEVRVKIDAISSLLHLLTPDAIDSIKKMSSLDVELIEKVIIASEKIQESRRDVLLVENGLHSIRRVVEMQNQVQYVSDARQNIGLVAGKIEDVSAVAEDIVFVRASVAMKPMIDETLALSVKMDAVLDMEEDMKDFIKTADRMEVVLKTMNQHRISVKEDLESSVNILNAITIAEKRIDEKVKYIENIESNIQTFNVVVEHVGPNEEAKHSFGRESNTLKLVIPQGKTGEKGNHKGDKGEPGSNGTNFEPSYMGTVINRARYNAYPVGTSYLSLDEIPTMIYFRKSNAINDWTEGQPFGVSNGGYSDEDKGIDIVDGINIDELTTHILQNMKRRQDGNIST